MTVRVHYQIDGRASAGTVLLSGSLGSDLGMWDPQVAPLVDAGFCVVRYDHRGHGRSPVPAGPYTIAELAGDLLDLLDHLGVRKTYVAGLSLGGMVGMWLSQHAQDRLTGLTLCCTSARLGPEEMWAERARLVREQGMAAVADAVVDRWLTPAYAAARPDVVERLTSMVLATPAEGYASCCQAIERMDLRSDLWRIHVPTLVVAGAQDPAAPVPHADLVARSVAAGKLEVLDPAAHLANVEQPERLTELLLDQLRATYRQEP